MCFGEPLKKSSGFLPGFLCAIHTTASSISCEGIKFPCLDDSFDPELIQWFQGCASVAFSVLTCKTVICPSVALPAGHDINVEEVCIWLRLETSRIAAVISFVGNYHAER